MIQTDRGVPIRNKDMAIKHGITDVKQGRIMNDLIIDPVLKSLIPPLSDEEFKQLEENHQSRRMQGCTGDLAGNYRGRAQPLQDL